MEFNTPPSLPVGIIGSDGVFPIYQPDARWTMWRWEEIYWGREGANKYVPKVDDLIVMPLSGDLFIVTFIPRDTFIPEVKPYNFKVTTVTDELTSNTDQNYRIYYDKTQTPYTLTPDAFLHTYSSEATVARIYKGMLIEDNNVISRVYNNSGVFIGHDIPLNTVAFNSHDNYSIKSIPGCNCTVELKDGEVCTIVVFDSRGKVVTRTTCIVDNTTYIAQAYAEQRYIINIYMKSVFIENNDSDTIEYPVNLPIQSFQPIGVVVYNDGTEVEHIVDGTKFKLYGMDAVADREDVDDGYINSFSSTVIGHKIPVVLTYRMEPGEKTIMSTGYDPTIVTRPYEMIVSKQNRSYGVKLFTYPEWIDEVTGYRLKFYMLNLDRDSFYDVTSYVYFTSNSRPFYPTSFGITQRINVALDLSSVSSSFDKFIHHQTVEIILRAHANNKHAGTFWEVASEYPTKSPYFGTELKAVLEGSEKKIVTIDNGCKNSDEFLEKLYYTTDPLKSPLEEQVAPKPTHIGLRYGNEGYVIKLKDFNKKHVFKKAFDLYTNLEVHFYQETARNRLTLSVANLVIRE